MSEVIPRTDKSPPESGVPPEKRTRSPVNEYMAAGTMVFGATLPLFVLQPLVGYHAIALIYLMIVVALALFVGRGPTLLAAALSALLWDFFFIAPIPNLRIRNAEDVVLFATYFIVALILGQLTTRIRAQERARREGEAWATALYLLTHELSEATDFDQLGQKVVQHLEQALEAKVALLLPTAGGRMNFQAHPASTYDIAGPEQPVADWVFENRRPGGRFTDHRPDCEALFLPLLSGGNVLGIIVLNPLSSEPPTPPQRQLMDAYAQQIALALDRQRLREDAEQAKLLAESERLSKTLLNSVSHEIRTPLAAIDGATGNLVELKEPALSEAQLAMVAEIREASKRLNRLVGKVLDITRLESGRVKPKLTPCDVSDLVHVAVKETRNELARHKVSVELAPGLPLVSADFVLLQQTLMNLLSNAAIHTPAGTAVRVSARVRDGVLVLAVADRGPGIRQESLARVFDKFYRGPGATTGGTGLGLSLVKGFVEAQGGQVRAENRPDGGAIFTIYLPLRQNPPDPVETNV